MSTPSSRPPHAYPKGLHGCYRGRLAREPRLISRDDKAPMATARIAVPMAGANKTKEERDALTEWVNVIAFDERCRHLLMSCSKGQLIAVMGGVTLDFYQSRTHGSRQISRTLIIEDLYSTAASIQPKEGHPADMDNQLKRRIESAAATTTEEVELGDDELPVLD